MRCTSPMNVWLPNVTAYEDLKKYGQYACYTDLRPQFRHPLSADTYFYLSRLPCGKCLGCALDKRQAWSVRGICEFSTSKSATFVTLTYRDSRVPRLDDGTHTLNRNDLTLFIKRLRERISPVKVRYLGCGEYGSKYDRPHYHLILYDFAVYRDNSDDFQRVQVQRMLEELWPHGFVSFAPADVGAIRYVAGYVAKKYGTKYPEKVQAPFIACSLKPAIGRKWFDKFGKDLVRFGDDGLEVSSTRVHLLDGSSVDIPPVMLRWWRSVCPDKDYVFRKIASRNALPDPLKVEDLAARAALLDVLHKEACQKGVNNV